MSEPNLTPLRAIRTFIDFSLKAQPGSVQREIVVQLGDEVPLAVLIQHAGAGEEPVVFDTVVVEIVYNDLGNSIIQTDNHDLPVAGELADNSPETRCFYS